MELSIIFVPPVAIVVTLVLFYSDKFRKRKLKEAKPYQFEMDKPIANFNDVTQHWHLESKRMYKGGQL